MNLDPAVCYEALRSRDARFDGQFFVGVSTTGIYCRPVCRVRLPGRDRCTFFGSAAAAEAAGYRPCLRCRPELAPGTSPVDGAARLADIAVARIEADALVSENLECLAAQLKISSRQLRRIIRQEYGVSPVQLAQTRRLLLAKQLLTDTAMPVHDVARASGFGSARRLHHLFQIRYRLSPGKLRQSGTRSGIAPPAEGGTLLLKLGYRPPLAWHPMLDFLGGRGASSAERVEGDVYLRTVRINDSTGWITARNNPQQCAICVEVSPSLLPVLPLLRSGVRQLFDLDANPDVIAAHLAQREELAPRLANTPGLRVPGAMNGFELALRAIIGQQISVRAATTIFSRIIEHFGSPITTPHAGLNRLPPTATAIADASTESLIACGLTGRRAQTIQTLARAVGNTEIVLEPGTAAAASLQRMALIPGIGPWTLQYVAMRALRDPDAFPESDLALLKSMNEVKPARLRSTAEPWRPWRAYAAMHIWNSLSAGG